MYDKIYESEFIGESLPKINNNFELVDSRLDGLETTTTQYKSLSGFFETHSDTNNVTFSRTSYTFNNQYMKSDVSGFQALNIVYPLPIYIKVPNDNATTTVKFQRKTNASSSFVEVSEFICSSGVASFLTVMDLGYYDWKIILQNTNGVDVECVIDAKTIN